MGADYVDAADTDFVLSRQNAVHECRAPLSTNAVRHIIGRAT
jgi:hypothetical protein